MAEFTLKVYSPPLWKQLTLKEPFQIRRDVATDGAKNALTSISEGMGK